ncbi:MAG TPA: diphosphate--fructose-6-phosphate 1-phosphotransferase [Tepidisphaeraceae bacterium]|nr:diphosphate--fructose-6-phosphate 1-phosphotransferase [Tepidisphaeraceae bacterium]
MNRPLPGNLLVLQGGGPTPVLNTSLFGIIHEARQHRAIRRMLGARYGVAGLLEDDLVDLSLLPQRELKQLKTTPGASLGSTRHKLTEADVEQIVTRLREREIRYLLLVGGNGSMRAADLIAQGAAALGHELSVIGVPKTIDNDIPLTDRCPGFGSAARYVAQSVRDLGLDIQSLPQPVSIYETMGRSSGWLAGASVLARGGLDEDQAPHLVYLSERPFEIERFLGDLDRAVTRLGWAVVVVPEGLLDAAGQPVFENASPAQRDTLNRPLPGGVCVQLAELVSQRLGIRCRWEKPGLCGRASSLHVSPVDREDAEQVGRAAVRGVLAGECGKMVSLRSLDARDHELCDFVPLSEVAGGERRIPAAWQEDSAESAVTTDFLRYLRPIVGGLVDYPVPLKDQLTAKRSFQRQHA